MNDQDRSINPNIPNAIPQGGIILKSLRTFQGDVAEAMKKQNTSVLSIALAEQNKPSSYAPPPKGKPIDFNKSERVIQKIPGSRPVPRPPQPPAESVEDKRKRIEEGNYHAPVLATVAPTPVPKPIEEVTQPVARPMARPAPPQFTAHSTVTFREPEPRFDPDFKKNLLTVVASIVLILAGIGSVVGFYILQKEAPSKVVVTPTETTLVGYDQKQTIPTDTLGRDNLIAKLSDAKANATLSPDQTLYIALTPDATSSTSITTSELFNILQTSAPGSLLRSFGDQFMFGFYGNGTAAPFLLIQVNDFDNAFDGMLTWEKTMNADIGSIFSPRSVPITAYVPTATTTLAGTSTSTIPVTSTVNPDLSQPAQFTDETYQNKDARVLKNFRGDPILLYSFLDNHTLLITSDDTVLEGLLNKLIASKLVH